LTKNTGAGQHWKLATLTHSLFGPVVFRTPFLLPSSKCSKSSQLQVQQLSETGQSAEPSTPKFEIGKLNLSGILELLSLFRLAVETASKLTYIKYNLILEHPELFKVNRQRGAESSEDKIINEIAADDILIEDCN
jgi:hypothetical protein